MMHAKLVREVKGLGPSDRKFKLNKINDKSNLCSPSNHCLVNIRTLNQVMRVSTVCSFCKCEPLQFTPTNVRGVIQDLDLFCNGCTNTDYVAAVPKYRNGRGDSSADNAANVHMILASFYLGKAGHALAVMAGALGLPNVKGVNGMFFKHYDLVGAAVRKVTGRLQKEALADEIERTLTEEDHKYMGLSEQILLDGAFRLDIPKVGLDVSYDMGWQKRSSGHKYDSPSGHGFLVGCRTRKVIGHVIYSKWCRICQLSERKETVAPEHQCPRNYLEKSSKSMEADGAVELVTGVHTLCNEQVYVKNFVSDDDASTRNILKHKDGTNKGELPDSMTPPEFLCDINHRVKVMAKPFFALASLPKRLSTCTKLDAIRIKRNIGWYIRGSIANDNICFDTFVRDAKAPILHHFDDHRCCDPSWCWKKDLDLKEHASIVNSVELMNTRSTRRLRSENVEPHIACDYSVGTEDVSDDDFTFADNDENADDEELEYDNDCSQSFVDRSTYFKGNDSPDLSFLTPKDAESKQKLILKLKDKHYRSMTTDEALYNQMV